MRYSESARVDDRACVSCDALRSAIDGNGDCSIASRSTRNTTTETFDTEFHRRILSIAGNHTIERLCGSLHGHLLRYHHRTRFEQEASDSSPKEHAAVVDAIENLITVVGVGRTSFPYERIGVRLLAATKEDRASLEPAFGQLESRVRELFRERRCDVTRTMSVSVSFVRSGPGKS